MVEARDARAGTQMQPPPQSLGERRPRPNFDPDGPTPLFEQIARILVDRIARGELLADRPIPSEKKLNEEFGVARGTARRVVERLRDDWGLVETVPHRGSFVKPGTVAVAARILGWD